MIKFCDLDNDLVFSCGFIEYIGRQRNLPRYKVVNILGRKNLRNLYKNASVFHNLTLDACLGEWEEMVIEFPHGDFINYQNSNFRVPEEFEVGEMYARIIQGLELEPIEGIIEIYNSKLSELIDDYNTYLVHTDSDYLVASYKAGKLLNEEIPLV